MAWAHVASTTRNGAGTSAGIDTTGATLLIIVMVRWQGVDNAVSDSKGNTWTAATSYWGGDGAVRFYYCLAPTVGASHTFTIGSGANTYPSGVFAAFSGHVGVLDRQSGGYAVGSTRQPGSLTPASAPALIVAGIESTTSGTTNPTIDSGFTKLASVGYGSNMASAMAWLNQDPAAAVNPTWSNVSTAFGSAVNMIVFTVSGSSVVKDPVSGLIPFAR